MVTHATFGREHDETLETTLDADVSGVLSAREAAVALGVTERTVRRAIARGELPAVKRGRAFRIERADLAEYGMWRRGHPRKNCRASPPKLVALPVPPRPRWRILPAPLDRFVGRERAVTELLGLLRREDVRLVTLTGPGGVGKTRLALEAATAVESEFRDGVAIVPLAAVRSPALVLPTIAQALDAQEPERPARESLIDALVDHEVLLVLDNLEQVIAVGPELVDLLRACPRLKLLATSRVPLHVTGERLLPVPPLDLPGETAAWRDIPSLSDLERIEALALFLDRAQAGAPEFTLTAENAPAVAAICARTDGLPLAIELAAARARALTPGDLLAAMSPRLPLLGDGVRDQPDRLRSMANAIAWSYDLLAGEEQAAFRQLAVFVGGFTFDAAATILHRAPPGASPTADVLTSLVDQSLIQRLPGSGDGFRYRLLETIREFGLERLAAHGEMAAARDAHADWCIAFAARAAPQLAGPDHVAWFYRIEAEIGNIRAALDWLFTRGDSARALRLGTVLSWFWQSAEHLWEGRALFARLLAMPAAESFPKAAAALGIAGSIEHQLGNLDRARELLEHALGIAQKRGDEREVVAALRTLSSIAVDRNDLEAARVLLDEVLARASLAGADWEAASASHLLAVVAFARGDYAGAASRAEEARAMWAAQGDTGHVGGALTTIARAALAGGDISRAAAVGRDVLGQLQDVEDDGYTAACFEVAAGVAHAGGESATAARLLAAAESMLARIGTPRAECFQSFFVQTRDAACRALGDRAFRSAWTAGETLAFAAATAEAFAAFDGALARGPAGWRTASDKVLTTREREVLRLLVAGLSDKEIAAALGISRHTVSNHVSALRDKLGVPSRAGAVALAVRDGLLAADR
jgi:excisionase family DNA binding protein